MSENLNLDNQFKINTSDIMGGVSMRKDNQPQ